MTSLSIRSIELLTHARQILYWSPHVIFVLRDELLLLFQLGSIKLLDSPGSCGIYICVRLAS